MHLQHIALDKFCIQTCKVGFSCLNSHVNLFYSPWVTVMAPKKKQIS